MGLFQRVPERKEYALPYTLTYGQSEFMLIIGLGNPGTKYNGTRHNIGFEIINELARQLNFDDFKENKDFKAIISQKTVGSSKVILAKPTTYMNNSGQSAQAITSYYKIPTSRILAVHDELSIKFGQIRSRVGGQAAGHNGVKSLLSQIDGDFGRIRVGIKNSQTPEDDTSSFVLSKFSPTEKKHLPELVKEASIMISEFIYSGDLPHDTRSIIL